jgi:3-methyl-2-oxobutanoate hydroxymethyltransferase
MKGKMTVPKIVGKKGKEKIAVITAYDCPTAKLAESGNADIILVGDSLGMVILGYENTLSVTMEDMIHHTKAVTRCAEKSLIVADMPFMSYQVSVKEALTNAGRLVQKGGAEAVKLEGGKRQAEKIKAIVETGIPVMGHIGLTPQSVNVFGGFKTQGKTLEAAEKILSDALILENAGVFAMVLEGIPEELAKLVSENIKIPTIGIGAGRYCDGQVLVFHDMLSIPKPCYFKFAKEFANAGSLMVEGITNYVADVKSGAFPQEDNVTHLDKDVLDSIVTKRKKIICK